VQILEARFREVLEIEEDMPHVRTAARVSMADLQKEVANLKNGLQDVQREIGRALEGNYVNEADECERIQMTV